MAKLAAEQGINLNGQQEKPKSIMDEVYEELERRGELWNHYSFQMHWKRIYLILVNQLLIYANQSI